MYPLMIQRGICEFVDLILGDFKIIGDPYCFPFVFFKFFEAPDNSLAHVLSNLSFQVIIKFNLKGMES